MTEVQEMYATIIRHLPEAERLLLAKLIISDLAPEPATTGDRHYAIDLLEQMPEGRLFRTPVEADTYLQEERDSWDH
ncbi:MAG TPA: hypothetical protein VNQ79_17920 [Blastocatellia bacterium]|nr:hypothetical protein [Blastocatellia bacterium]